MAAATFIIDGNRAFNVGHIVIAKYWPGKAGGIVELDEETEQTVVSRGYPAELHLTLTALEVDQPNEDGPACTVSQTVKIKGAAADKGWEVLRSYVAWPNYASLGMERESGVAA